VQEQGQEISHGGYVSLAADACFYIMSCVDSAAMCFVFALVLLCLCVPICVYISSFV
jgi:hypothetical protein